MKTSPYWMSTATHHLLLHITPSNSVTSLCTEPRWPSILSEESLQDLLMGLGRKRGQEPEDDSWATAEGMWSPKRNTRKRPLRGTASHHTISKNTVVLLGIMFMMTNRLASCFLVGNSILALQNRIAVANRRHQQQQRLRYHSGKLCEESKAVLIDVENLRGKSGFSLTHDEVMSALAIWTQESNLQGKVSLVIDHGSEPSAFWLADAAYAVLFAGNSQKADDVLALDLVPHFSNLDKLTVVTADQDLIHRCRRASGMRQTLHILSPMELLVDIEHILAENPMEIVADSLENDTVQTAGSGELEKKLEYEIRLGGELLEAEALIRSRSRVNNKRRKKLKQKANMIREKLAKARAENPSGFSVVDQVTEILLHGRQSSSLNTMSKEQQDYLLSRWEKVRKASNRREKTGDRVILAEQLRRHLLDKYGTHQGEGASSDNMTEVLSVAQTFVARRQSSLLQDVTPSDDASTLRLVIVSDTHGYEEQLTLHSEGGMLPEGDILLHLGDFSIDGGPVKEYFDKFDKWLSRQPHQVKVVVRGNHDPRRLHFPVSHAKYITRPQTLSIGGYSFFVAPSGSILAKRMVPRSCNVLVSHVPPKGLLDRTVSGAHVGSGKLRHAAERMKGGAPSLWLCGHIHESRGYLNHVFVGDTETLVVNAANANDGKATCVEHGPVVVTLQCSRETGGRVEAGIELMDDQYEHLNKRSMPFFSDDAVPDVENELLVAVDLGLRTGVSLFNDQGQLLRYDQYHFENPEELYNAALDIVTTWGTQASNSTHNWAVSRIAIEGGDPPLQQAWVRASNGERALIQVKPEEWRADLLTRKEKADGESAKAASRLIARQIVADYGIMGQHEGKFHTDMAESVLLGLHVSRRLGWISRNPAVRRFSNGKVIVP